MTNYLDPSNMLNPLALWTDFGLRALETTVSSSQNISDGVDRMTRAVADTELAGRGEPAAALSERSAAAVASTLPMAARLQRSTFDLMMQGWVQWMSTLGTLASLGAGLGMGQATRQKDRALNVMGWSQGAAETAPAQPGSAAHQSGRQERQSRAGNEHVEHAFASAGPKRRRSSTPRKKARSRRA